MCQKRALALDGKRSTFGTQLNAWRITIYTHHHVIALEDDSGVTIASNAWANHKIVAVDSRIFELHRSTRGNEDTSVHRKRAGNGHAVPGSSVIGGVFSLQFVEIAVPFRLFGYFERIQDDIVYVHSNLVIQVVADIDGTASATTDACSNGIKAILPISLNQ